MCVFFIYCMDNFTSPCYAPSPYIASCFSFQLGIWTLIERGKALRPWRRCSSRNLYRNFSPFLPTLYTVPLPCVYVVVFSFLLDYCFLPLLSVLLSSQKAVTHCFFPGSSFYPLPLPFSYFFCPQLQRGKLFRHGALSVFGRAIWEKPVCVLFVHIVTRSFESLSWTLPFRHCSKYLFVHFHLLSSPVPSHIATSIYSSTHILSPRLRSHPSLHI